MEEFIDTGFGFEVKLLNVPLLKIRGEWTPKINYNNLALQVLRALAHKMSRLTGDEIHFIRTHFEMTLQEFAKRFYVTHVAVMKWEKTKKSSTGMNWTTEKDIRLSILRHVGSKAADLVKLYSELENTPSEKPCLINLRMRRLAA